MIVWLKELERQFAPIMWIVNKDKKETYDTHIKVSTIGIKRTLIHNI